VLNSGSPVEGEGGVAVAVTEERSIDSGLGCGAAGASTGLGWAGGYVGTGVTTTNLAGRTLADLVLGRDTDLVHLPWVGHRAKRWEPEPLRWLAVNAIYAAYHAADRHEARGRPATSPIAKLADLISGH